MDNVTLNLPSGYVITFKPYLNYGQQRQITKMMSSKMSIDPLTQEKKTSIDGGTLLEAQDLALKSLLVSIKTPDNRELTGEEGFGEIQNMRSIDGDAVYAKVDELTNPNASDENKKKLQSSNSSEQAEA